MKKVFISTLVLSAVMASCSQSELDDQGNLGGVNNPKAINFAASTTRAAINNLDALKASADGFVVYGSKGASASAWEAGLDGTNNYKFASNRWGWASGTAPQWPSPFEQMNFYAYYPASASGFGAPSVTAGSAISSEITVQRNVTGQTDFLAANSGAVLSKPLTGALALNFTHIMSKVGFGLTQEVGTTTTIQQLGFENLINKGTYDYVGSVWQTLVNTNKGSFDDYVALGAANAVEMEGTGAKGNVRSDNEFYMFIPQAGGTTADKVALWDGTGTADANGVLAPANAYISMIYRTHKPGVTPLDVLGYAERSSSSAETEWSEGSNAAEYAKYKKGGTYTGELFIKVGFKMEAAQLSWLNGKGYTYNMLLNQAGGLYLSEYYFDEDGNNTKIRVTGSPDVTDPVFGTDIMFDVTVSDWDNTTPETEI